MGVLPTHTARFKTAVILAVASAASHAACLYDLEFSAVAIAYECHTIRNAVSTLERGGGKLASGRGKSDQKACLLRQPTAASWTKHHIAPKPEEWGIVTVGKLH